jgi:uncharacterized protein YbjQ (UPF0145 family)
MPAMSGLSGNEMYCLNLKGFAPGELVIGNSVYSLGFLGSLGAGLRTMAGGEVSQITEVIHEGRLQAYDRMIGEAAEHGGHGITSVASDLKNFHGNVEFLSVGTCVHQAGSSGRDLQFSTSHDGQELYCQLDAGFTPIKFVFGNVAYAIGLGGGIIGGLKSLVRGEIKELGGLLEFMAIGTAVKRVANLKTVTPTLPPQAIIRDKDTWISHDQGLYQTVKSGKHDE